MQADERSHQVQRVSRVGLLGNLVLTLLKYAAGILGHSAAMVADATHSLSDLVTDVIVLAGMRVAHKPADRGHGYGHGKVETFLALLCGVSLMLVGAGIFWSGACRILLVLRGGEIAAPGKVALFAAALSVAAKEWMYRYTLKASREFGSPALRAKAWDHRSDAFSSVGTLVGVAGAVFLSPRWRVLDPLAALVVSFFILRVAVPIVYESLNELLEASLEVETEEEICREICSVDGVLGYHRLKTRRLGPDIAVEVHIQVDPGLSICRAHDISTAVENRLGRRYGERTHISVHVEPLEPGRHSHPCPRNDGVPADRERRGSMVRRYELNVPDMSCHHCVARISRVLEEIEVPEYRVLLEDKVVEVETDDLDKVIAALDEAGYEAMPKDEREQAK